MHRFSPRRSLLIQAAGVFVAVVMAAAPEFWWSWQGRGVFYPLAVPVVVVLGLLLVLACGLVVTVFLPARGGQLLVLSAAGLGGVHTGGGLVDVAHRHALTGCAEHARPLVGAITKFTSERGRPPRDLEELVPRYLGAIPRTGLRAWPWFRYEVLAPAVEARASAAWCLWVDCGSELRAERLVYGSPKDPVVAPYSERRRIGDWLHLVQR